MLATLGFGCGDSDAPRKTDTGPSSETEPQIPDFGSIGVEPIEEDGSQEGLNIAPNLVENLSEVRDAFPMLEKSQLSLALMIQAHKLQRPDELEQIFSLVSDANARGIDVRPIPVLSADEGYFPNATNHQSFAAVTRDLIEKWRARDLSPTTLVVDMEPPRELMEALASLDLATALPNEHIDRARYAAGQETYTALVDELHAAGFKVAMTTQATLLADYRDEDDDLRQYFNVVIEGPNWDELEFQLYRSAFGKQAPGLDSHFVYDFARTAQERFPDKTVGVALGVIHPGPVYPDTATLGAPAELRKDAAAAVAAGIPRERIGIYNLKGILLGPPKCDKLLGCEPSDYQYGSNEPSQWLTPADNHDAPSESAATGVLWTQLDLMDGLLDVMRAAEDIAQVAEEVLP